MSCTVVNSQSGLKSQLPALSGTMPTTQAGWNQFVNTLNLWAQALKNASAPINVIPAQYALYQGVSLPAFDTIGCSVALDSSQIYYGSSSLKVTVTSVGATLAFTGFPVIMPTAQKWFCSWQIYNNFALTGSLAVTTAAGNVISQAFTIPDGTSDITDDTADLLTDTAGDLLTGVDWQQVWGLFDLRPYASNKATWTFTFNTTGTFWIDGLQMVVVGDIFTGPIPFGNFQSPTVIDHMTDGEYFTRASAKDFTTNRVDFSKSLLNKQLDNIPDGSTFARTKTANMTGNVIDPAKGGLTATGSIPPTVPAQSFTYTSTTTSVTISWLSLTIYRPDGTATVVGASSLTISGLSASTTYKVYPYYDDAGGSGLQFVSGGTGVGTPASCYPSAGDAVAAQQMYLNGHIPLNGFTVVTPSSGGGSGGGGGGACLHPDTLVALADGSARTAKELCVGDVLPCPRGTGKIIRAIRSYHSRWFGVSHKNGEIYVTPDHIFYRADGELVRARDVRLGDILSGDDANAEITGLRLLINGTYLVSIELEAPHLYYVGGLLSHNPKP